MKLDVTDKISSDLLYALVAQGDQDAYYQLFEIHWERLYSIAYRIVKQKDIAQDIVQELFLSLWEKRSSKEVENIEAYLVRAAKFSALKEIRDDHFKNSEQIETLSNVEQNSFNDLEYKELRTQVDQAIEELPDKCKEVFKLSRNDQLTNQEIADKLKLSKRTVETHISNALKQLRKTLPKDQILGFLLFLLN